MINDAYPKPKDKDPDIYERRCSNGHDYLITRIEWISYKGTLPMPCPICIGLGMRQVGGRRPMRGLGDAMDS